MTTINEPEYTYIKGQGWVIEPPTIVTTRDGFKVKLEFRKPVNGELFFCGYPKEYNYNNIEHVKRCTMRFPVWGGNNWSEKDEERPNLVVVIPL
jgi:hypothetical protein